MSTPWIAASWRATVSALSIAHGVQPVLNVMSLWIAGFPVSRARILQRMTFP
jgi:hypothetical protein